MCIKKYSEVKQNKNKFQTIKVNKEQKVEWSGKNDLHRYSTYPSIYPLSSLLKR